MSRRSDLRAAPVVGNERNVMQIELLDERCEQFGEAMQREIGVAVHWSSVPAEGQYRDHAPMERNESWNDVAPKGRVHDEATDEHDDGAVSSTVFVVDNPARQLHG